MLLLPYSVAAQDPTGTIEGTVIDATMSVVPGARVTARQADTRFTREAVAGADGFFRLSLLPVGEYSVTVEAPKFSTAVQERVPVTVSQTVRLSVQLELSSVTDVVTVSGGVQLVDTSTNALGRVITGRELVDLPLNGRNFTQLGLLQTGVAPLTAGVATAGGSLRQGQAYAVNGMRPEQNIYLVDGAQNMNRMDGGFAVRIPVDAIAEFRILTQSAPPEYGGTGGATTSVVTRSGSNRFNGSVYDFVRNDAFDARNFFSREVEPLNQNQFGVTLGGPLQTDRAFFFGYYEGFRNKQGITTTATVPTAQERVGDFSALSTPLLNLAAGGVPFPGNQLPPNAINPVARNVVNLYPLGNVSPSIYRETLVGRNVIDQIGGRVDFNASASDQLFGRYWYSGGHNINPVSVRGTDVPGYPTRDDLATHSGLVSSTRIFSPSLTNSLRATWLRHEFLFDQRLNRRPPRELGFGYDSANALGQGPPFFNVSGYSPIGGAITGPRNSTQTTFEVHDGMTWTRGAHLVKVGGEVRRTAIDMIQAIAPNAFFVFAGTFPTNNAIANLLLGAPVTFYQGLGDFNRGVRLWNVGLYAQDEWRLGNRLTMNYGLRYERINPLTEVQDRLTGFVPGVQSQVRPDAPRGLVFPGDPGVGAGIAHGAHAFMPRIGFAWDPTGSGTWSVRSSYGLFYDQFQNGAGTTSQVAISSIPWAQFNQFSGAGLNFQNPYDQRALPAPNTFVRPSTVFAMDVNAKPPYAQNWNSAFSDPWPDTTSWKFDMWGPRARGCRGTSRRTRRSMPPAPQRRTPTGAAFTRTARPTAVPATSRRLPCCRTSRAPASIPARWHSRDGMRPALDSTSGTGSRNLWTTLSAMNLSGAAAKPLAGENDLAQNPFDLDAEYGPSLFDARHRFVASASWEPRLPDSSHRTLRAVLDAWQVNVITTFNSGTPFTVSDSANVALQSNSPPISGFAASRPNLIGDPNAGPRTVDEWISRSAFQRLNPQTDAGQFGNAGRNIARGPSYTNVDVSFVRTLPLGDDLRLQLRAECFNVLNHPNFGLPVADLNSPNFGRILSAGPPRLVQFAFKLIF